MSQIWRPLWTTKRYMRRQEMPSKDTRGEPATCGNNQPSKNNSDHSNVLISHHTEMWRYKCVMFIHLPGSQDQPVTY
jgi:hypothetical protein